MDQEVSPSLQWFCIFPYDLLKLICFKYTDPKTRYSMLLTCKRLFSEFYQYAFQRRWLMIGKEPPSKIDYPTKYRQCNQCNLLLHVRKSTHKCKGPDGQTFYCIWCFERTREKHSGNHVCKRILRCNACGLLLKQNHKCPLQKVVCYCGSKHQRILFQKCEVCVFTGRLKARLNCFCPYALPRCKEHEIYECFGCQELVDCAVLEIGTRHICKLLKHCVEAELGVRLIKYAEDAYITETGIGPTKDLKIMFVKTSKSIPSLLEFGRVRVCLFNDKLPVLLNFAQEPERIVQPVHMELAFLSRCKICCCTIMKNLAACTCRRAVFCKNGGCRQFDPEHSKHKKLK